MVLEDVLREGNSLAAVQFGPNPGIGCAKQRILLGIKIELGPNSGVVQHQHYVALPDDVAVLDADLLHRSAVEVLYALAIAFHLDDSVGEHGAVQRGKSRPAAEDAEEGNDDQQADIGRHPDRIRSQDTGFAGQAPVGESAVAHRSLRPQLIGLPPPLEPPAG